MGSTQANFADSMRRAQIFTAISNFDGVRVAHIGLVVGPTSAPDAPTQDQATHAKPGLRPNPPKLRHVGPQLGSSGPKWEPIGPSSAQVTPKWGPSGLLFGPT